MIEPQDFMSSGKFMLGDVEINNRNAISRIYYGVYHISLNFASNYLGFTYVSGQSRHKQLINFFKSYDNRKLKVIGRQMEKLRNARNEADYSLESFISSEDAKCELQRAIHTIAQIEQQKKTQSP